jgi:hypothetical protein
VDENIVALDVAVNAAAAVEVPGCNIITQPISACGGKGSSALEALANFSTHIRNKRLRNLKLCDEGREAAAIHMLHKNPTAEDGVNKNTSAGFGLGV